MMLVVFCGRGSGLWCVVQAKRHESRRHRLQWKPQGGGENDDQAQESLHGRALESSTATKFNRLLRAT
jgi:hypothetical protein